MNRSNLALMADYLEGELKAPFDMGRMATCILGHRKHINFDWVNDVRCASDDETEWLFGYGWKYSDNTPIGAAKRIRYFLANGVPYNWHEQITGKIPIQY